MSARLAGRVEDLAVAADSRRTTASITSSTPSGGERSSVRSRSATNVRRAAKRHRRDIGGGTSHCQAGRPRHAPASAPNAGLQRQRRRRRGTPATGRRDRAGPMGFRQRQCRKQRKRRRQPACSGHRSQRVGRWRDQQHGDLGQPALSRTSTRISAASQKAPITAKIAPAIATAADCVGEASDEAQHAAKKGATSRTESSRRWRARSARRSPTGARAGRHRLPDRRSHSLDLDANKLNKRTRTCPALRIVFG